MVGVGLLALLTLLTLLSAGGCAYEVIRETPKGGNILSRLADEGKLRVEGDEADGQAQRRQRSLGYTVLLETYRGPDRMRKAHARIRELKEQAGLADLWSVDREGTLRLYHGRFPRRDDPLARVAIENVRRAEIDGQRPYRRAELTPLGADGAAAEVDYSDMNLRRFSDQGLLTLQVAVYNSDYGTDFRKAAEQAARALREDGDRAFYYHGPHRSMVTVGLFDFDTHFVQKGPQRAYGPEIVKLQKKYPYNLVNGVTVIEKTKSGEVIGEQSSSVVRVP